MHSSRQSSHVSSLLTVLITLSLLGILFNSQSKIMLICYIGKINWSLYWPGEAVTTMHNANNNFRRVMSSPLDLLSQVIHWIIKNKYYFIGDNNLLNYILYAYFAPQFKSIYFCTCEHLISVPSNFSSVKQRNMQGFWCISQADENLPFNQSTSSKAMPMWPCWCLIFAIELNKTAQFRKTLLNQYLCYISSKVKI